jgi:hypothetical protein
MEKQADVALPHVVTQHLTWANSCQDLSNVQPDKQNIFSFSLLILIEGFTGL